MTRGTYLGGLASAAFGAERLRARGHARRPVRSILVVGAGSSPTYDFYLAPRLAPHLERRPVRIATLQEHPRQILADVGVDGTFILFVRYVSAAWLAALEEHGSRLAGCGLLLDDDIPAVIDDQTAPLDYRLRLVARHSRHVRRLSGLLDLLYVATPRLQALHSDGPSIVLPPCVTAADAPLPARPPGPLRLAFHATGVHAAEHQWAVPVLTTVVHRCAEVVLDVYTDRITHNLWRDVPRVVRRPSVPWPEYREATRQIGADLLFAPLLASPANAARSPSKRIDAWRQGAAFVTTATAIYGVDGDEAVAGAQCPAHPEAAAAHLVGLLSDAKELAALRLQNQRVREGWPQPGCLPGLD